MKYVQDIMQKFHMDTAYPMNSPMTTDAVKLEPSSDNAHKQDKRLPYRSLVGCLQYLVSGSRPELATAIRILSKFLEKYNTVHWSAAKRVLRYLSGSRNMGLHYNLVEARKFEGFHIEKG
ncbi:Copia protein [Phytophthora megakarya]|uniref:Copia protein n=1 Tax=Phytophthora megakarya TaxID=4795 RepID=A0A225VQG1_9STRA|nr:Copia protein [Phytophthora megakarya]